MSKYLHCFDTSTSFNSAYNDSNYTEPWVSYVTETETVAFDKEQPEVTILSKEAKGTAYEYRTEPNLFSLIPTTDYFSNSLSYKVYFNNVLFTSTTKMTWTAGQYGDESRNFFRMSNKSNSEYYNYYFYAYIDDYGKIVTNNNNYNYIPCAVLPDSFGEVGDKIKVRIEK